MMQGYRKEFIWWEMVEMGRKLLLASILYLISNISGVVIALLICMIAVPIQVQFKPFSVPISNFMQTLALIATCVAYLVALMLKLDSNRDLDTLWGVLLIMLLSLPVVLLIFFGLIKLWAKFRKVDDKYQKWLQKYFEPADKKESADMKGGDIEIQDIKV